MHTGKFCSKKHLCPTNSHRARLPPPNSSFHHLTHVVSLSDSSLWGTVSQCSVSYYCGLNTMGHYVGHPVGMSAFSLECKSTTSQLTPLSTWLRPLPTLAFLCDVADRRFPCTWGGVLCSLFFGSTLHFLCWWYTLQERIPSCGWPVVSEPPSKRTIEDPCWHWWKNGGLAASTHFSLGCREVLMICKAKRKALASVVVKVRPSSPGLQTRPKKSANLI